MRAQLHRRPLAVSSFPTLLMVLYFPLSLYNIFPPDVKSLVSVHECRIADLNLIFIPRAAEEAAPHLNSLLLALIFSTLLDVLDSFKRFPLTKAFALL